MTSERFLKMKFLNFIIIMSQIDVTLSVIEQTTAAELAKHVTQREKKIAKSRTASQFSRALKSTSESRSFSESRLSEKELVSTKEKERRRESNLCLKCEENDHRIAFCRNE